MDYTPEGIKAHQLELTVAYLNLIDKKLNKANRCLTVLTLTSVAGLYLITVGAGKTRKQLKKIASSVKESIKSKGE